MKSKLIDIIDFQRINTLLEGFNKATGFVTAILDLEGNVLSKSGWRQICTEFHRIHPETSKKCTISDTELAGKMSEGKNYHSYKCLNGLIDVVVPVIINDEHVANLFSGQFFFEKPDLNFFEEQAKKYKFDHKTFLEALDSVPVVSEEKVKNAMDFLLDMTLLISEMTQHKIEQIELNKTLEESEERWKFAIEGSGNGLWDWDVQSNEVFFSTQWKAMLGYQDHEIGNKLDEWDKRVHPDDKVAAYEAIKNHLDGITEVYSNEHRIQCKDGNYIWIEDRGKIISRTENNKPLRLIGTHRDITEQKIAEIELFESQEKFKRSFHSSPVAQAILSLKGEFVESNLAFSKLVGYSRSEIIGKTVNELGLLSPQEREKLSLEVDESTGSIQNVHTIYCISDGSLRNILYSAETISINGVMHRLSMGIDITERIQAEEAWKKSEEELKKAQEIAHIGNWRLDFATNKVVWSEELYKMYGFDPALPPPPLTESNTMFTPESWELLETSIAKTRETGIPYEIELQLTRKDGTMGWMWARGEAVLDKADNIVGLWGATQDITERKRVEEKLKNSETKFKAVAEMSPIAIYASVGDHQKGIYINKDFHKIFGFTLEEVPTVGEWWIKAFPNEKYRQEVIDQWTYNIEQAEKNNTDVEALQCICTCKDGSEKIIAWVGKNINDEFWAYGYDLTETKRAEELIRENDNQFKKLSSNLSDLIFQFTRKPDGSYIVPIASEGIQNIFGCSPEDVRDDFTPIVRVILPEDAERIYNEIEYSAQHLTNFNAEFRVQIPGKEIQWTYAKSTPEKLADGSIVWYGFVANITERKLAQKALKKSDEKYKLLFELLPDTLMVTRNGLIETVNNAALELFGIKSKSEIINTDSIEWVDQESLEIVKTRVNNLFQEPVKIPIAEYNIVQKNGKVRQIETQSASMTDEKGMFSLAILRDITERKLSESELRKHKEHLEELIEERTRELEVKYAELERMNKLFVGRELRMVELKEKIRKLENETKPF